MSRVVHHSPEDQAVPALERTIRPEEIADLSTVDQAVIGMRNTAARIRTMTIALGAGEHVMSGTATALDTEGQFFDAELRKINEQQKQLELLTADNEALRAQVRRQATDLRAKDKQLEELRSELGRVDQQLADLTEAGMMGLEDGSDMFDESTLSVSQRGDGGSGAVPGSFRKTSFMAASSSPLRRHKSIAGGVVSDDGGGSSPNASFASPTARPSFAGPGLKSILTAKSLASRARSNLAMRRSQSVAMSPGALSRRPTSRVFTSQDGGFSSDFVGSNPNRPVPLAWTDVDLSPLFPTVIRPSATGDTADAVMHAPAGDRTTLVCRCFDVIAIDESMTGLTLAAKQAHTLILEVAARHNGVVLRAEISHLAFVFADPAAACECAVEVQQGLVALEWPPCVEDYSETTLRLDPDSGNVLWQGVRVAAGIHCGGVTAERELLTGDAKFFGFGLMAAEVLAHQAPWGVTVMDPSVATRLEEFAAVMDAPRVEFLRWTDHPVVLRSLQPPGWLDGDAMPAQKLHSLLPWMLAPRVAEARADLFERADCVPLLADGDVPPDAGAFEAVEAVAPHAVHVALEPPKSLPTGALCFVLVRVQNYATLAARFGSDESPAVSAMNPLFTMITDTKPEDAYASKRARDRALLAFRDVAAATKFALDVLQRSATMSYPLARGANADCVAHFGPQKRHGRALGPGPQVVVALHYAVVEAKRPMFQSEAIFTSPELLLLHEASNAAVGTSLVLTEPVYAMVALALPTLMSHQFVHCEHAVVSPALAAHGMMPLFTLVPRPLIHRYVDSVEQAALDALPADADAARRKAEAAAAYAARWRLIKARDAMGRDVAVVPPSVARLREYSAASVPKLQQCMAKHYFRTVAVALEHATLLRQWAAQRVQRAGSGVGRPAALLEAAECALMAVHDDAVTVPEVRRLVGDVGSAMPLTVAEARALAATGGHTGGASSPSASPPAPLTRNQSGATTPAAIMSRTPAAVSAAQSPVIASLNISERPAHAAVHGIGAYSPLSPDAERLFLEAKLARTAADVQHMHLVLESIFRVSQRFLDPLVDVTAPSLADDECVSLILRGERTARHRVAAPDSVAIAAPPPPPSLTLADDWMALLERTVDVTKTASPADYESSALCASAVGHAARHFLYLRSLSRRLSRESVLADSMSTAMSSPRAARRARVKAPEALSSSPLGAPEVLTSMEVPSTASQEPV